MEIKTLKKSIFLAIVMILILLVVMTTATYAWFTFTSSSTVEPLAGTVNGDGVELLISNSYDGPFDATCDLILSNKTEIISPVTTNNLSSWYTVSGQNKEGIATKFAQMDAADVDKVLLHGTVYLYAMNHDCAVYLLPSAMHFGNDVQALASMRLGLSIEGINGTSTYIFDVGSGYNLNGATEKKTVEKDNCVYNGTALVADPAEPINGAYSATGEEENILPGTTPITTIHPQTPYACEYWVWIEGCDINCFNDVQSKDLELSLGFAGFTAE